MGKIIAKKIGGMSLWGKVGIVFLLLMGIFTYQGLLKPLIGDSATKIYYFTLDSAAVNLGADGNTNTTRTLNGKISLKTGVYATSQRVSALTNNTTEQTMVRAYTPVYATKQTISAPAVTIGVRDGNGSTNLIDWKAYVYDYNPAGAANNGTLIWTSNAKEAHPSVQTPIEFTFPSKVSYDIDPGHRLKVVITSKAAVNGSAARLYWGSSTNYSFFSVSEAPYIANSVTVNNLSDYYAGKLTSVIQGDSNIPMLQFDLSSNVGGGVSWTGGKLNKTGTNTTVYMSEEEPGDVSFFIYKDADGDNLFETSDTLVGGPYTFSQLTGQSYTLTTPQAINTTPQRYFITYNILRYATYNTSVGATILAEADSTYFSFAVAPAGGVRNVTAIPALETSLPVIQYGGVAINKTYPADWDAGTSLTGIAETGAESITDSTCITRNTAGSGFPLTGLLNYPVHSCTSIAGQGYSTTTTQADFARLYFGGAGYPSAMKAIKGGSFVYRVYTPAGGGTVTLRLFYVTSGGVRVNAPIASTYTVTNSVSQTITTSLAGQDFSTVPIGARLGIQIGVTANMRIGLGSSVGAQLTVQETAAENENVDVGNGLTIPNANVYASDTSKTINAFTMSAAKTKIVNAITVTGNAMFNSTNVQTVKIYADAGTVGTLDGADTLLGSTSTFSGNSATISGLTQSINYKTSKYLVVVDITGTPNTNVVLTALVSNLTIATTGILGVNTDKASATLTILPTTTVSNFITAEPPNLIIPWNAGKTRLNTFGLKTNGGVNDTISNVTVFLTTTSTLPVGKVISDYIGQVDIVNGAGVSLGHLAAPTQNDDWQVVTNGLAATATGTDYYVTITPKGNQNITFTVKAEVDLVNHARLSNKLVISDIAGATITLDQQPPDPDPVLTAVTGAYSSPDADKGEINLSWIGTTDLSGSAITYKLVRGLGNAPPPRNCVTDGVKSFQVYLGPALSYTDINLYEGVSYGYRVCAIDSVGNITAGSAKSTTASIKNRCSEPPKLSIDPMTSYLKAGNSVTMAVGITNKDTGSCPATTFTLSIVGTDADDTNFTTSTFAANNFIISTNNGSQYTSLNITAKPGAAEKAIKTFHVKVAKSSGAETSCPDPIYAVVNKYGNMMHSSLQVGTSRYGSWGLNYDCATCHSPNATNIKQVKNVISTPTGDRPVEFSIISTSQGAGVTGVMGNDSRAGTTSTNVCEVCHHRARFHQYSASKVVWKQHNNNGDCLKCHPHNTGFKSIGTAGACDDCHGNPPTSQPELVIPPTNVLFPYATNAGSHEKHNSRGLNCASCHSNSNHILSATPVGDKKLNMGFSIKGANFTGFVGNISSGTLRALPPANNYVWTSAAGLTIQQAPATIMNCNVYCHGWEGNGGYNSEPAWTGITQVGCGSCHAAAGDVPPTSGSHHKHASTDPGFGNGVACSKCHGFRNYSTSSAHINGVVEWDLSTITPTALYRGVNSGSTGAVAPTAPGNYGSCANLYCHSNVVQPNNNGVGAPTVFSNPTWGGITNCNSCHPSAPNTTGGHPQHAGGTITGFDCRICHASGGDANPLNHANSKIDFTFVGLGENTHYSYSSVKTPGSGTYGTCYNGNCHGSRRPINGATSLAWGPENTAIPLCDKCHGSASSAGGFYSTEGPNGTKSTTDPYVGAHFRHISSSGAYKYSAKIVCGSCHYNPTGPYSPGHIDSPLPAEVNFGSLAASGLQGTFTSAAHQPTYNFGTKTCNNLWCHGGGMDSNEGTGPYGSAVLDGGAFGAPAPVVWNAPFLNGTGPNDCVKCHAFPPAAPISGYTHYDDNNSRPYIANQCVLCHKHLNSDGYTFKNPALHVNGVVDSCNTCHGRPPIDEAGVTRPSIGALTVGLVGAHQAHALNPSIGKDCYVCHYNYDQEMPSYKMEMGFNAYGGRVSRGTFYGYSTLSTNPNNPADFYTPKIVYFSNRTSTIVRRTTNVNKLNTCENLYCHGGGSGAALPALGGGTNIKPNWEIGSSQATCGTCHGVTGYTYNVRGSHGAHTGTGYGKVQLSCSNCHGIKENNYHVDGKVEWEFYSTAKRLNLLIANPGYTPAVGNGSFGASGFTTKLAPSTAYGTCNVYCHSNGKGTFSPVVWGGGALNCGSCHINQTSSFSGSHLKHSGSTASGGYAIDCLICHYGSGSGSAMHVNGTIDIIFNTAVVGPSGTWNNTNKTCFNILCHDSTVSTGPDWDIPASGAYTGGTYKPTCIGCHSGEVGGRTAVVPQFVGESHHIQGVSLNSSYCYPCHMEANTNGTVNGTYHDLLPNKTVDLVIWGAGARGAVFTKYTANGTAAGKRNQYAKISNHCVGCHNATNAATTPFSTAGDNRTPKAYSWDGVDINAKYSDAGTTPWGKFSGNDTNNKSTATKAYSAHGNAINNFRGYSTGVVGTDTYAYKKFATKNVVCFDCHNSHGTSASGIMSSYSSATGRYKGGILKSTVAGVGGYATSTYTPTGGGSKATKDLYNPGAGLCFDCHGNQTTGTVYPWGYNDTYGIPAKKVIYGYWDSLFFSGSGFPAATRYPYKAGTGNDKNVHVGGHYGASSPLMGTITQRTFANGIKDNTYAIYTSVAKPNSSPINGLCTPCHDPHGVSSNATYVKNKAYAVPLLKGSWVTSPYKEDAAPASKTETRGGATSPRPRGAVAVGSTPRYYIDQNTFQTRTSGVPAQLQIYGAFATAPKTIPAGNVMGNYSTVRTGGLCTGCHAKAQLVNANAATSTNWKTKERIHQTVTGWAATTGAAGTNVNNAVHAFTCSKCHTPHNYRLPRLMVTNCLDANHRGNAVSGGAAKTAPGAPGAPIVGSRTGGSGAGVSGGGAGRFPSGGGGSTGRTSATNPGPWFFGTSHDSTGSIPTLATLTTCHQRATAGGATYGGYTTMKWNNKTMW